MTVSSLVQTAPERVTVRFEGGHEIKSTLSAVTQARLAAGRELGEEELESFALASRRALALEKAAEYLAGRPMSRKELADKMRRKGTDAETASYCAEKLSSMGLIDEAAYAGLIVRHYASKGYGAARLKAELMRRGIDRETAGAALDEAPDGEEKIEAYIARRLTDPSDRAQIMKITGALFRRGFSREEIRRAMEKITSESEEY